MTTGSSQSSQGRPSGTEALAPYTHDTGQQETASSSPHLPKSDTSLIYTSPMPNKRRNPEAWHAKRVRQGQRKRIETLQRQREDNRQMELLVDIEEESEPDDRRTQPPLPALFPEFATDSSLPPSDPESASSSDDEIPLTQDNILCQILQNVLRELAHHGLRLGHLLDYLFNTGNKTGFIRYHGFFQDRECVFRVLNNWVHWRNGRGRELMLEWILQYMSMKVSEEGSDATRKGFLQSATKDINESFALDYDPIDLYAKVQTSCPIMTTLLSSFATTSRQATTMTAKRQNRKQKRIASAALTLLGERSQRNSYMKHVMGLYLYASGAQRQVISVCSSLGVSSSYQTIVGTKKYDHSGELDSTSKASKTPSTGTLGENRPEDDKSNVDDSDSSDDEESDTGDEEVFEGDVGHGERLWFDDDIPNSPMVATVPSQVTSEENDWRTPPSQNNNHTRHRTVTVDEVEDKETGRSRASRASESQSSTLPRGTNRGEGLLPRLSEACRASAHASAQREELGIVYDNINWVQKAAEQVFGRKDAQQNGTCATAFSLIDGAKENMKTADLLKSYNEAPPLSLSDLLLTKAEQRLHRQAMIHTILRVIVAHGGEGFAKFNKDVRQSLPITDEQIPIVKTTIFPLPAMDIDESSTKGNADVVDAIFTELKHDVNSGKFFETVRPINGDQLSIARLRGSSNDRVGHDSLWRSYLNLCPANGFFHGELHLAFGTLETHFGNPSLGPHDPGSLCFHNTVLDRKPIVLSSLPPYHTCRDLVFVSLYARVLHCLELIAGKTLQEYTEDLTFLELKKDAERLYDTYVNSRTVDRLRAERAATESETTETRPAGDMVFENAILALRDSLIMREFTDAIKAGDSGRIIVCLKNLVFCYRGCGRVKYAYEMLVLIHHLTHIWPKPLRNIIIRNWLVNPTGRPNSFVPVDLLQEHMNLWIKIIYQAQGSAASWEWLAMISPCINILRALATQINEKLGSKQGVKHHSPDLTLDIQELMKSLRRHRVYAEQTGRIIEGIKATVPDVIIVGLHNLQKPLEEYNAQFVRLRTRRVVQPLIVDGWEALRALSNTRAAIDADSGLVVPALASEERVQTAFDADDGMSVSEVEDEDEFTSFFGSEGAHEDEYRCSIDDEADVILDMD